MKGVRKIALVNGKGGCGKTTSLFSIAGVLAAEKNKKVFVIDLDKQKNTTSTMTMNVEENEVPKNTIMNVLKGCPVEDALCRVMWQPRGRRDFVKYSVDVLCGDEFIDSADGIASISEKDLAEAGDKINKFIKSNGYDWVLVDMPPSSKIINDFCFKYLADYMLCPFSPDEYSADGYQLILNDVQEARGINPNARIIGIFMNKKDSRFGLHKYFVDNLKELDSYICEVPYESAVAESVYFGRPVNLYRSLSKGANSYRKIVREVDKRISKDS